MITFFALTDISKNCIFSCTENGCHFGRIKKHVHNVVQMYKSFQEYVKKLRSDNGSLSHFWMSYIDLVSLLLNLIRASREGNWSLHLSSIREMILWCFSYNRTNYARYLPWYYREIKCLPQTNCAIHNYLQNGGFSCQIGSQNTFGMIPMGQTIEEKINKDTPTAGGTKRI